MIENVRNNHVAPMGGMNTAPHADAANRQAVDDSDATIQVNFADMVNRALQTPDADVDAVEQAKQLLQSNRLTSPENVRAAAENILAFGI